MTRSRLTTGWIIAGSLVLGIVAVVTMLVTAPTPPGSGSAPVSTQVFADGPTVAFYGDSYTLGTGASDTALRWSTVISTDRGWNEMNPSVNGLGFVNNRDRQSGPDLVDQVIAADPDIVLITMGLNDNFSMPARADDVQAAITADFDALRRSLPDARIVAVEPFWYTDARPDSLNQISSWVRAAADAIGADHISGASSWIAGHPEWMAADGLHPNDAGYAAMTARMDQELTALGL